MNMPNQTAGSQAPAHPQSPTSNPAIPALAPDQALELFNQDPVAFVQAIAQGTAEQQLANMKEEAELRGTLNSFRKAHPEMSRFEPFIMQEVAMLIQNDPDGHIAPWEQLLETALGNFQRKFQDTLAEGLPIQNSKNEPPYQEGTTNRNTGSQPASFTRQQIAKMSLADFLKNEAAINDALKNKRIR